MMAIYTNVVQEFRTEIESHLSLNDVIDTLIAQKLIDEKLYIEIWGNQDRVRCLLNIILKDGERCKNFVKILGNISHMKQISASVRSIVDKIFEMIVKGGFPEFSLNYVVRNSIADRIRDQALNLDPKICGTLVVHGLPGFGKSCLVNQVLQTKRFLDISGGAMFWINLGEHLDTTAVINPLWNLYLTAVKLTDFMVLSHRPDDITILQSEVKRIFLDDHLAKSYVILDDVKSSEVFKVFKLRCKTIVTTQDKNVADNAEAYFVNVTTGFTKKESLELLRKSLDVENLSSKECFVNKIHELCDGCPMLLNIIGSILKDSREEALSTEIIWDSLISEIIKNDYLPHPTTMKVIHMIQRSVSCLPPETQKYFHSLAVFPKHVNIRPEILKKLWNKESRSLRQIMVDLESKSLIVSFYNKDLRTYIYSIHSLVRTYLVEKSQIDIKYYHKKMISECDDVLNDAPLDDPIANYIYGYYGYHAKNAEMYDKFEKYFDLRFIENKIKRVGSADLLTDFETYRDLITRKQSRLERKLKDFINFVNSYSAHLHISPETNIVQFAFFSDNSCVYEEARTIALNNPDQLYFKLEPYSGHHKNFPILKTKSTATTTCFLDSREILVGTSSGTIEVKSFHQYHHKLQRFEGHGDQVFRLCLSPEGKSFLSISLDGTAKLWRFVEELDPQSPKLKQTNWKNLHSPDEKIQPRNTFKLQDKDYITSAAFPYDDSDEIVTASRSGKITRWNIRTAAIIRESALGLPITQISYAHASKHIIFSYDGKVYVYSRENLVYNWQFGLLDDITDLVLIPIHGDFKEVAVIGGKKVEIWEYENKIRKFDFEADFKVSCAVVNSDYLMVGTGSYIYLYNYRKPGILQYKNGEGPPTSLCMSGDRLIYITLDKENVQRCELFLEPNEKPLVHDLALFGCHWKDSVPIYFIVNSQNKIDIFNGHSIILTGIDEIPQNISCASFSLCGSYLILGTEDGRIFFYNYKKKKVTQLKVCDDCVKLIKCVEVETRNLETCDSMSSCGMVVVASSKKIVIIVEDRVKIELEISSELSHLFYLCNQLVTIDAKGKFSLASVFDDHCLGWVNGKYKDIIVANIHKEKKLLGIVSNETRGYILRILSFTLDNPVAIKTVLEAKVGSRPTCMSFSSSGKLVSIGCDDGDIEIFHLETDLHDIMSLHKKSVERVVFAPNFESIMVSVGDQIAWWNVNEKLSQEESLVFNFDPWENKKRHDTVPYLLTSTNLHGKQLKYVSASKDFRSFLIVDVDGNIFKMDIINS